MASTVETSKIRVKVGTVEIEYEGERRFIEEGLPELLQTLINFRDVSPSGDEEPVKEQRKVQPKGKHPLTVGAIAVKLGSETGNDLVVAAAAKLTLIDSKESFSRDALLEAMRSATAHYNKNHSGNLSKMLKQLQLAGRLNEISKDTYALSADELNALEQKLA